MRNIIPAILITLFLLAGCRQGVGDSPGLVGLDSLIAAAPDSAAARLAAWPTDSLRTAADRAYHALLLTQARYKAYIPLDSGSLDTVNVAVAHYADGHDPEKQTRSLLYKGCVMEELARPDSAMYCYKAAEDHAARSGDDYQRGYALMRMASLYQSRYALREAIEAYKKSLSCFERVNAPAWRLSVSLSLANQYQTVNLDSAFYYVNQALDYSRTLDSVRYDECLSTLSSCHLLNEDYRACIAAAKASVSRCTDRDVYFRSCHWAAQAFAMLGESDSGTYWLGLAPLPANKADSVLFLRTKGMLSPDSSRYLLLSGDMADTLVDMDAVVTLTNTSKRYDQLKSQASAHRKSRNTLSLLTVAVIIILIVSSLVYWTRKRKERAMASAIEESGKIISSLRSDLKASDNLAAARQAEIGQLSGELSNQKHRVMEIVNEMLQNATIYHQTLMMQEMDNETVSVEFRRYVNATFMSKLKGLLDVAYPRLAQRMSDAHCDSDNEDTVYLHFAGFTNDMICSYLNLTNKKSISNKKRAIATMILGENASINQLAE